MRFRDEYYFLSNMYPAPIELEINGQTLVFDNAEAAFHAMKCPPRASEFTGIDGYAAKKAGRRVNLRPDWEKIKLNWMHDVLLAKFSQNQKLKEQLLATGDMELVEDNTWNDTYWGRCNGKGQNNLGWLLMLVRGELRDKDN